MFFGHQSDNETIADRTNKTAVLFGIVWRVFVFRYLSTDGAFLSSHWIPPLYILFCGLAVLFNQELDSLFQQGPQGFASFDG
jgi:hypothetical protein